MLRIGRFFDLDSLCGYKRAEIEVRNSVTIDWAVRENVRAQMRVIIKRILRKYGYPLISSFTRPTLCWSRRKFFAKTGRKRRRRRGSLFGIAASSAKSAIGERMLLRERRVPSLQFRRASRARTEFGGSCAGFAGSKKRDPKYNPRPTGAEADERRVSHDDRMSEVQRC